MGKPFYKLIQKPRISGILCAPPAVSTNWGMRAETIKRFPTKGQKKKSPTNADHTFLSECDLQLRREEVRSRLMRSVKCIVLHS